MKLSTRARAPYYLDMRLSPPIRLGTAALGLLALLSVLVLALLDTVFALILAASLAAGWVVLLLAALARDIYRRHRRIVLGGLGLAALALLVLLRPDGAPRSEADGPGDVPHYAAELWPRRGAMPPSFILRENLGTSPARDVSSEASSRRAPLEPVRTGPFMREIRYAPGSSVGADPIRLGDDGRAVIVLNPLDDGEFYQVRRGRARRVLVSGEVRIELRSLPGEMRIAYLPGGGGVLRAIAAPVAPIRALPLPLAALLFGVVGLAIAFAWADRLVAPARRRFDETPPRPPRPGSAGPIERAPLVPRPK